MNIRSSVWMSPGMRYHYLGATVVRGFLLVYLFPPPFRPGSGCEPLYRCKIRVGQLSDLGGWDYRPPWKRAVHSRPAPNDMLYDFLVRSSLVIVSKDKLRIELCRNGKKKKEEKDSLHL